MKLQGLCEDRLASAARWEAGGEQHIRTESGFLFCRDRVGLRHVHYLKGAKTLGREAVIQLTERCWQQIFWQAKEDLLLPNVHVKLKVRNEV